MGNIFATKKITLEEKKEIVNNRHKLILSIMNYPEKLDSDQKNKVIIVFRSLMKCYFFETTTEDRLYNEITEHINEWHKFNPEKSVDKNKFINDTTNKLNKYLIYYVCELMRNYD